MDHSLQVTHIRSVNGSRQTHHAQSRSHVLHVAFNNVITASEKRFDGRPIRVEPGRTVARTLYLPAESELKGWSTGQVDFLRIQISCKALQDAAADAGRPFSTILKAAAPLYDPLIWHAACILRTDLQNGSPGGTLLQDSMQNVLARHLAIPDLGRVASAAIPAGALPPSRHRAVCEYIAHHLHQEIRLADLAALTGLSVFHFARAFKNLTGKSPYQYVMEQRLEAACRLLESTGLSVAEIGLATGFVTSTGFTASFRRKWGLTPTAYRRAVGVASGGHARAR